MSTRQNHFWNKNGEEYCESVPLSKLAQEFGTPCYVYSEAALSENGHALKAAFSSYPTLPCYAVKANTNGVLLRSIFAMGFGADVVSVGELERALRAGAKPDQIVFSGVGKQKHEIERALTVGIFSFNVESGSELELLKEIASTHKIEIPFMLRVNPNIDVKTNPYIATGLYTTKFGIAEDEAMELARRLVDDEHLKLIGLSCHIGSQILEVRPFQEAAARMATLAGECAALGHPIQAIDLGGGLGIQYAEQSPPSMEDYAKALLGAVRKTELRLIIEPGRCVVGSAGVLLSKVVATKRTPKKNFVVLDAAMNDLIRPSLYEAHHTIGPVHHFEGMETLVDFVGPICETGDLLGLDRKVLWPERGDLFVIRDTGAYGYSMSSQYNSRPRAPEILVSGATYKVIRPRETLESLWKNEVDTAHT